jgi:DNA-binding CsgD family transcriptional regulator
VNHVILFLYILLMAGGTGGVVALALLHHRLRTPITASLLVANIGLFAALVLALVFFYIDHIVVADPSGAAFAFVELRTALGYLFGVMIYGGVTAAVLRLPAAPRRVTLGAAALVLLAMSGQVGLILTGNMDLAIRLSAVYLVAVSIGLAAFGVVMIRAGSSAPTATMAWLIRRLGYLAFAFAVVTPPLYVLLAALPFTESLGINFDFFFYIAWCGLSIAAFIRYLTRPAPAESDEHLSRAFVTSFGITPREEEIVRLVGEGLSNQEIADRLHISFGTVRTHVYNIFQKTGAGSRVDLVRLVSGFRE